MPEMKYVGFVIKLTAKRFEQLLNAKAEQIGLTSVQMRVLHYLCTDAEKEICQRDIEERFGLSHATVSGVVSRLEAKGFIESVASQSDRRYKTVKATLKAVKCVGEMQEYILETEQQATKGITEAEKESLRNILDKILQNLGSEGSESATQRREDQ